MTFPTIPTVAAGRILFTLNTAGGATKTFPNLGSLTKDAGDLLIAICIEYDGNSTNAEFSSWGGSFTEFADFAGTTTMAIGAAYKFSTGAETGTFTVTTADTTVNDSVLILMSIPGAHASTPPETGGFATGVNATVADPAAFDPTGWAAEDTLWIAVGGSGEDSATGSYTGVASAPTNYTDYADSGITADVIGGVEGAVAFRQLSAASEDVGTFGVDTSNARNSALVIAVRPRVVIAVNQIIETSTAQVVTGLKALASAQVIETNTAEVITRVHARTLGQAIEDNVAQPITLGAVGDANAGATVRIERCGPDGTPISTIVSETINQGAGEIVTTDGGGATSITIPAGSVTDTTLDPGDRLRVTLWTDDAGDQGGTGNMVAGQSVQFYINGPVGFSGQARATFAETLTQFAGAATIVGRATETDTAQSIGKKKTKVISTNDPDQYANEFDPPVTETGIAQVITARKTKAIGQAVETDVAAVVTRPGAINRATETDLAQPVARVKTRLLSQAVETDVSQVVAGRKTKTIGQANESDTATVVSRPGGIGQTLETDTAQPVARRKTRLVSQVIETNTAQAVTGRKAKAIGQPLETDTSNAITERKTKLVAQAVELDSASSVARPGVVSKVIETDTAQPIARIKRKSIGQLTEVSTAFATARRKIKIVGQPVETDLARIIRTPARVGKVTETDIAQPVLAVKRKTIGSVTELTVANAVARSHSRMLGTGLETSTSTAFGRHKTVILGRATETNIAALMVFGGLGSTLSVIAAHSSYSFIAGYPSVHTGYVLEHEFVAAASELVEV